MSPNANTAVSGICSTANELECLHGLYGPEEMTVLKDLEGNIALDFEPKDVKMKLREGQCVWLSIQLTSLYPQEPAKYEVAAPFLSQEELAEIEILLGKVSQYSYHFKISQ